jgi:TP901 family phage tail tape measure protein
MAGFDPKAIKAAMPGMLDLASAGGSELAETADIASNIMSGLGLGAAEMDKLGDVLVGTFTRSNTNLRMLGETMKYAAPMAKTYGVDLETAAAMAGKLGDAGLQGSMGGTALSSIMNRLAAPPKAAEKALEKLNIKTADANGNLRAMPDILKEIYDKTKGMGTAVRGGLLKDIAGEEAVKGSWWSRQAMAICRR